ncbi:MAG TPA: hypothetical protein IGS17_19790 [Oscillatoriales cyanobacterium M59_W2019_021]|nr:hypothetical protein [Oscillatoriales cyanobacterium M4454_W2019_049]HIK53134.1 hypothetical protein [Oscillatoriales cyanobacterium M59_W2019_021]
MKRKSSIWTLVISLELVLLAACSNAPQATNSEPPPPSETTASSPEATPAESAATDHPQTSQSGQVIESGSYHLELLPVPESDGIHLDFFLQKGDNHEAIPDANVTAQVQLPDGEQKTLEMEYDPEGKHYVAFLPSNAPGEYKVAVQTDLNGEKVNGRFSFSK